MEFLSLQITVTLLNHFFLCSLIFLFPRIFVKVYEYQFVFSICSQTKHWMLSIMHFLFSDKNIINTSTYLACAAACLHEKKM